MLIQLAKLDLIVTHRQSVEQVVLRRQDPSHSSGDGEDARAADVVGERLGIEATIDPDLREKSYGEAGGKPQAWLDRRFVPPPESGDRMRHHEGIEGAETRWDCAVRAHAAMERIQDSAAESQIVISHGGSATHLLAAWIGRPIEAAGL